MRSVKRALQVVARSAVFGLSELRHQRGALGLAIAGVAASVFLVGLALLLHGNLRSLAEEQPGAAQMIVYFDEGVSVDRARRIADVLGQVFCGRRSTLCV